MRTVHNFRWHARAGQGAVTASKALADVAAAEGRYVQAFAEYGAEKRGAPVVASTASARSRYASTAPSLSRTGSSAWTRR